MKSLFVFNKNIECFKLNEVFRTLCWKNYLTKRTIFEELVAIRIQAIFLTRIPRSSEIALGRCRVLFVGFLFAVHNTGKLP